MEEATIINDLINENPNDFDQITSCSTAEFEELRDKVLSESNFQISETISELVQNNNEEKSLSDEIRLEEGVKQSGDIQNDKIKRPCQFAISRIKSIMKTDPDLALASKESVFLIAKATVN
jgi:hypothetical protein